MLAITMMMAENSTTPAISGTSKDRGGLDR